MDARFPSISPGTTVAFESVGSKTMNRKMKSTLHGEFDGIPSRRDQLNKWAQHIQLPPAIQLENHFSQDPRKWIDHLVFWSKPAMQQYLERPALKAEFAQNHYLLQQQKSWPQIQSRNQIYCAVGSQELLNLEINSIITSVRELINRNATSADQQEIGCIHAVLKTKPTT